MESVNFTLIADESIAKDFGKKGTESDLTIYDKKEGDIIRTWTVPTGYPEKIQPLLQSLNMSEYVILDVSKLDKFTGEQIIAIDSLKKTHGFITHAYEVDRNTLLSMIENTSLQNGSKSNESLNLYSAVIVSPPVTLLNTEVPSRSDEGRSGQILASFPTKRAVANLSDSNL